MDIIVPTKTYYATRFKKYTDVDKLPYGINTVVAIASWQDIIKKMRVLNKTAVERGYLNQHIIEVIVNLKIEKGQKIYFTSPISKKC